MSFYGSRLWQQQLPMWFVGSAPEQTEWLGTAWFGREPARVRRTGSGATWEREKKEVLDKATLGFLVGDLCLFLCYFCPMMLL